jgi:hypothetical protein
LLFSWPSDLFDPRSRLRRFTEIPFPGDQLGASEDSAVRQLTTLEAADLVTLGSRVSSTSLGESVLLGLDGRTACRPSQARRLVPSRTQELVVEQDIAETPTAATGRDVVRQP